MDSHYTPPLCPNCGVELPPHKINMCAEIARVVCIRPDLSYSEIGNLYHVSERTVKRYAHRAGLHRKRGAKSKTM